eukprot:2778785-Rhodomonas_salina.2
MMVLRLRPLSAHMPDSRHLVATFRCEAVTRTSWLSKPSRWTPSSSSRGWRQPRTPPRRRTRMKP